MEKLDLSTIGTQVEIPRALTYRPGKPQRPVDRLTELADWWATVGSGPAAVPPERVAHLWSVAPGSAAPGGTEVVIGRFEGPDDVLEAIDWAVAAADVAVDDGSDLLLVSVPDVRWQVLSAYLIGLDAVESMGWPQATGIGDGEWIVRVAAIRDGLRALRGTTEQPERLLAQLASPLIAAGTGLLLRAAARRTPCLLDGPGALTCALLASRLSGAATSWWRAGDAGTGTLTERILTELSMVPLTRLGLVDEDGTAARIGLNLLETAVARAADRAQHEPAPGPLSVDDVQDAT